MTSKGGQYKLSNMIKSVFYILFSLTSISAHCYGLATTEEAPQAEVKKAQSPIEGTWVATDSWDGVDKEEDLAIRLEFKGDKVIANFEGDSEIAGYTIDPKKQQIIITSENEIIKGIYKIEKDILTLCYNSENEGFPETFEIGEDKAVILLKLKMPIDKKFQGKWICIESWESGEKTDDDESKELTFRISEHLFEVFDGEEQIDDDGKEVMSDEACLMTVDTKLKKIILDDEMGDKYNCIYQLEEDVLTIHFYANTDKEGNNADFPKDYKITQNSILLKLKKNPAKKAEE